MTSSLRSPPAATWFTLAYALCLGWFLWSHPMWRDEAQQFLILRASHSLGQLLTNLRYEGHPLVWYLVLWPFTLANDVELTKIPGYLISVSTVFLGLRVICATNVERLLFILGYYIVFEFSVVTRSYMLGTLFMLGAVAAGSRNRPLTAAGLIGLAANTHILFIAFMPGFFLWVAGRQRPDFNLKALWAAGIWKPGLIMAGTGALALWQIWPTENSGNFVPFDTQHLIRLPLFCWFALFPASPSDFTPLPWLFLCFLSATCIAVPLLGWFIWRSDRPTGLMYAGSGVALMGLLYINYAIADRHVGIFTILALVCLALIRNSPAPRSIAWQRLHRFALIGVLYSQAVVGVGELQKVDLIPYSYGRAAASFLRQYCQADCTIVAQMDDAASTISGYLGARPIFYANRMDFGTFSMWDEARYLFFNKDKDVEITNTAQAGRLFPNPVIVLVDQPTPALAERLGLVPLRAFAPALAIHESFYLYRLAPAAMPPADQPGDRH